MKKLKELLSIAVFAFYKPEVFQTVATSWRGIGAFYLLLLTMCSVIPLTFHAELLIRSYVKTTIPEFFMHMPDIQVKDDTVIFNKPMPYELKNDQGNTILVIDTTGKLTSLENSKVDALLTKHTLYWRATDGQLLSLPVKGDSLQIKVNQVTQSVEQAVGLLMLYFYVMLVLIAYVYFLLFALLIAAIIVAFSRAQSSSITYGCAVRVAVVSLTPPVLIASYFLAFLPLPWLINELIFTMITIGYVYFAYKSVAQLKQQENND